MCFRRSLAHSRKTQLPKAAWAPQLEPVQPRQSPPPRATSRVPSGAVPHGATQPSRQARTERPIGVGFPRPGSCPRGFCPVCSRGPAQGPLGEDDERLSARSRATCATLCHQEARFSVREVLKVVPTGANPRPSDHRRLDRFRRGRRCLWRPWLRL
jgi:hypothetical protein